MQEDIDDRGNEDTALQAMEEPFYELLGEKYPAFPQQQPLCVCDHLQNLSANTDKSNGHACNTWSVTRMTNISSSMNSNGNFQGFQFPWSLSSITRETEQFTHHSNRMVVGLKVDGLSISEKPSQDNCSLQIDAHYMRKHPLFEVHDRKSYPCIEDLDLLEGRSNKQYAIYYDEPIRDEMFDNVLLCSDHKPLDEGVSLSRAMTNNSSKSSQIGQGKTSARRKTTGKRIQKRDVVDLRTLLINCAQAVSVSNHSLASDILKIIRHHASPTGDDSQRLALCLAYCLDVRLTGTGSQIYHKFITKRRNVKDILKGKPQVHIIDFGICFGFQWPSLFEELAKIEDGPPKLRITGIELPESGFRPYARRPERIERPESYKKWKVRNLKAGLVQLPLNPAIVRETQDMVRKGYHKDFLVDEEDQWLVLGWKGRILYASSTWQPNDSGRRPPPSQSSAIERPSITRTPLSWPHPPEAEGTYWSGVESDRVYRDCSLNNRGPLCNGIPFLNGMIPVSDDFYHVSGDTREISCDTYQVLDDFYHVSGDTYEISDDTYRISASSAAMRHAGLVASGHVLRCPCIASRRSSLPEAASSAIHSHATPGARRRRPRRSSSLEAASSAVHSHAPELIVGGCILRRPQPCHAGSSSLETASPTIHTPCYAGARAAVML
uniref:Uncharacterized protein n=1 Tax=Oryza sativa subsp. japonica TaxID=39947 RepID=Q84TZ7_ORYSJ|nr:hypothetical protein [Oryza sativa Japonica Group]